MTMGISTKKDAEKSCVKFKKEIIITFLFVFLFGSGFEVQASTSRYYDPYEAYKTPTTNGKTYYVSASVGNDSYDGLAPEFDGIHGPWKTIRKYCDPAVNRGMSRLLIRTGKYNENVVLPSTWTYGSSESERTVIAAYGDGDVIIDTSITKNLGVWTVHSGNIWKSKFSVSPESGVSALIINNDFKSYHPKTSLADMTGDGDWYYDSATTTLFVQTSLSVGNPKDNDVIIVEKFKTVYIGNGISLPNNANYVTISGLTVRGSKFCGIYSAYADYINIEKCKIIFNFTSGIGIAYSSYSKIFKNKIFGNCMANWPRGKVTSWGAGIGGIKNDNMLVSGNIIIDNGGEGITLFDSARGHNTHADNIIGDNWSVNLYLDTQVHPIVLRNFIYTSQPKEADACQGGCPYTLSEILVRLNAPGIEISDEYYDDAPLFKDAEIYNNIIVGGYAGILKLRGKEGSGLKDTSIYNNTIITSNRNTGIFIPYCGYNSGSVIKNNIIIALNSLVANWILSEGLDDTGIKWDNNLYYSYNKTTPMSYKGKAYDFSGWKTQTNQDANSKYEDPKLVRTDWSLMSLFGTPTCSLNSCSTIKDITGVDINDFALQAFSPAINAGANVGLASDFAGNLIEDLPDIGAYEFQSLLTISSNAPPAEPTGLSAQCQLEQQ